MELATLGLILGAGGTAANLFSQAKARREAKKAAAEQARRDAFHSLMVAAGGGTPSAPTPIDPAPVVDYGGAVANMGSLMMQSGQANKENALKERQLNIAQSEADAMGSYRTALGEYYKNKGGESGKPSFDDFMKYRFGTDSLGGPSYRLSPEAERNLDAMYPGWGGGAAVNPDDRLGLLGDGVVSGAASSGDEDNFLSWLRRFKQSRR